MEKENNRRRVTTALLFCCVFMFSFSLSSTIYTTLAPFVIEHFGIDLIQSSWISVTANVGNMLINLVLMVFGDRFDKHKVLVVLNIVLGISLLCIGYAPGMAVYLIANCISGMAGYWVDNVTTAYVSDLYGYNRGRYIGILYTLFAVASALAPTFNTLIIDVFGLTWQHSYLISGVFILTAALSYVVITRIVGRPETAVSVAEDGDTGRVSLGAMLGNRNMLAMLLSGVTMSFYSYFSATLPTFFSFTDPGTYTTALRNFIVTCSSVGAMVSRFLYVPLAPRLKPIKYLRFQSLFCTACGLIALLINRPVVWMVLSFLSGMLSGSAYTMKTVLTCDEYPDSSSSANAAVAFASGISFMAATPIINYIAEKVDFVTAMFIPLAFGFATYLIYRFVYKEHKGHSPWPEKT